jgi:Family of unknown function (DUF5908)
MALHIEDLMINIDLSPGAPIGRNSTSHQTVMQPSPDELIEVCVEKIMDLLSQREEP